MQKPGAICRAIFRAGGPAMFLAMALVAAALAPVVASAATSEVLSPADDARVRKSEPSANYGSRTLLRADASSRYDSYLRFVLDDLPGSVQRAELRLYATASSSNGPALYQTAATDWSESTITWNNAPGRTGTPFGDLGRVSSDTWVAFDVTRYVTGDGVYAFDLVGTSSDGVEFTSSEGTSARRPQLVLTTSDSPPPPPPSPGSGRPNILLIVTDDQRADTVDAMPRTREWLAAGGTTFPEGYVTTPLCCPARSTNFSGRYMHNHGVYENGEAEKLDQRWTIQRYLKDAGYRTAMVGKFLTGWSGSDAPPNFDHYALSSGGYFDAHFNVDGHSRTVDYSTDFLGEQAVDFLGGFEADDSKPWFLYLAPQAPHDPFDPAPRHEDADVPAFQPSPGVFETDKSDKASFLRSKDQSLSTSRANHDAQLRILLSLDEAIDAVFRQLVATGEADNTLVVFTADNGYFWGEHGLTSKGLPYTEAVKVPFMVRWPGRVRARAVDPRMVAGVDLLPTFLAAAGYTPPVVGYPHDGRNILGPAPRHKMLLEFHEGHRGYPSWASIRTPTTQYIEYYDDDDTTVTWREYYDLVADPYQLQSTLKDGNAGNDPDVAALSEELARYRRCRGSDGASACP